MPGLPRDGLDGFEDLSLLVAREGLVELDAQGRYLRQAEGDQERDEAKIGERRVDVLQEATGGADQATVGFLAVKRPSPELTQPRKSQIEDVKAVPVPLEGEHDLRGAEVHRDGERGEDDGKRRDRRGIAETGGQVSVHPRLDRPYRRNHDGGCRKGHRHGIARPKRTDPEDHGNHAEQSVAVRVTHGQQASPR